MENLLTTRTTLVALGDPFAGPERVMYCFHRFRHELYATDVDIGSFHVRAPSTAYSNADVSVWVLDGDLNAIR